MSRGTFGAGVFYALVGVVFLLDRVDAIDLRPVLAFPLLVVAAGVAVLAASLMPRLPEDDRF